MEEFNPIVATAQHLLDTGNYSLVGKSIYNGSTRTSNVVKHLMTNDTLLDEIGIFRYVKGSTFNAPDFAASVKAVLVDHFKEEIDNKANDILGDMDSNLDPSLFKIYKDIEEESTYGDKDMFLVLSKDYSIVKDVSISTYRHLLTEEVYSQIKPKIPLAYKKFNPYLINETLQDKRWKQYVDSFRSEMTHINTCKQPDWRYNRDLSAKISDEEKFFIESSFNTKEDLQYYINSAYHTVIDKMWSYVMLYGIKGTGKTTLIEMLIHCVGKYNYRKAPQNALKKEFNGYKKDKRLILMDEMVANTNEAVNILKSDANKEFNVEEKSQVSEAVENFVSMWIATNNISDWKFTHDERRFSVLELTTKTTEERGIEDSWMGEFSQRIETEGWANAFFNYLEENKSEDFNTMAPYKTDIFWKVVYESLSEWERLTVDTIISESHSEIQIADIWGETPPKTVPTNHKKITDFLANYKHNGKPLGTYKKGRSVKASHIIPIEEYRPRTEEGSL